MPRKRISIAAIDRMRRNSRIQRAFDRFQRRLDLIEQITRWKIVLHAECSKCDKEFGALETFFESNQLRQNNFNCPVCISSADRSWVGTFEVLVTFKNQPLDLGNRMKLSDMLSRASLKGDDDRALISLFFGNMIPESRHFPVNSGWKEIILEPQYSILSNKAVAFIVQRHFSEIKEIRKNRPKY